jgi:antitoxin (DNA-binding transcriptional repressor) of toxin-antitoxin stability system
MTLTVSISDLRNNISDYLEKVMKGTKVFVKDEKRGITIAEIVHTSTFDNDAYEKSLRKVAGIFRSENHPEWKTKKDVINWVKKSRLASERKF